MLKNKSEVAVEFTEFFAFAETQTGNRVKLHRSDWGREYKFRKMTFATDVNTYHKSIQVATSIYTGDKPLL